MHEDLQANFWVVSTVAFLLVGSGCRKTKEHGESSAIDPPVANSVRYSGESRASARSNTTSTSPGEVAIHRNGLQALRIFSTENGSLTKTAAAALQLTPNEQQETNNAARQVMDHAKKRRALDFDGSEIELDSTIEFPALDAEELQKLREEYATALPASTSLTLRALLVEKFGELLLSEYGSILRITLIYDGNLDPTVLRHLPANYAGYSLNLEYIQGDKKRTESQPPVFQRGSKYDFIRITSNLEPRLQGIGEPEHK